MKDLGTFQVLLRCDSSGDLYPAPPSFQPPVALLSDNTSLCHKRLGHPSANVLNNLISNHVLSCNKTSSSFNYQACQLGKHIRLLFSSSISHVSRCFEIDHSDL